MRRTMLTAVGAALIVLGCSSAARDRLKHFFFEIPEERVETADAADGSPPGDAAAGSGQSILEPSPVRFASHHEPFRSRDCDACHDASDRMHVVDDFETTCEECHERYFGDDVGHDPVAAGECFECHDPHRSTFRALLKRSILDTCVDCHDFPEDLSQPTHAGSDATQCVTCHDAHFGKSPLLKPGASGASAGGPE